MTLIIYAKCADGIVVVSDRQASTGGGEKRIVNKIYSPSNKRFILALAGDGLRIEQVYSSFDTNPSLNEGDVRSVVKSILDSSFTTDSDGNVEGILMIKNGATRYQTFRVYTHRHITTIIKLTNSFECFGLSPAKTIANFLSQFGDIENKKLEKVCGFLIASMDIISKNFDGIGTLHEGFDVLTISNMGSISECPCLTEKNIRKIVLSFEPSTKNILSLFSTIQSSSKKKHKKIKTSRRKIKTSNRKIKKISTSVSPILFTGITSRLQSLNTTQDQPTSLINIARQTCKQCGRELGLFDSVDSQGRCNICTPRTR